MPSSMQTSLGSVKTPSYHICGRKVAPASGLFGFLYVA
jgi:hypothetical protein